MGFKIDARVSSLDGVDTAELESYLQQMLQDATGESASRVVIHSSVVQSPNDALRQLRRLQRNDQ